MPLISIGQNQLPVRLENIDSEEIPFFLKKYAKPIFEEELENVATEIKSSLLGAGYAAASIDSFFISKDTVVYQIFVGSKYEIGDLTIPDSSLSLLEELGVKTKQKKPRVLNQQNLIGFQENVLQKLEQNGYPYAAVNFNNANISATNLSLDMDINKGPYIQFDTIANKNKAPVSKGYLSTYLGIKANRPYDQLLVKDIDNKLAELPFVKITQPTRLWFSSDGLAHVEVFLAERKVSKFDFLIGVLPNNDNSGKVLITGEAGISLWNIFGTGKKIDVQWKRLKPQSQQLKVYFDYPYILNTALGADINFELDKQDTSFLDLNYSVGIQYLLKGRDRLKIIVDNNQTFVLNADTTFVKSTGRLPPILDQNTFLTGFEIYFEKLNYIYNPNRGWEIGLTTTAGFKKIRRNTSLLQLSLPENMPTTAMLYDSLAQRSAKFEFSWMINYYLPITDRQVVKFGLDGGNTFNKNLLTNELIRIGGNNRLRGFDEESIYTSLYNVSTIEYRYLLDQNAYFAVFFDWAYTERRLADSFDNDFPFGFGAGLNFETKAGIFGLTYAVGRQNGNPIDFKSSKIHFGYVNIF